jgi:hypothetical protein
VFSGPRTALGTVKSGEFSAQCGSAHGSVFESVRELSCSKNSQLLVKDFHLKKDHTYSQETGDFSSLTNPKFC